MTSRERPLTVRYVSYNVRRFRTPDAARSFARSLARSYDYCRCSLFEDAGSFVVVSECHVVRIEGSTDRVPTRRGGGRDGFPVSR